MLNPFLPGFLMVRLARGCRVRKVPVCQGSGWGWGLDRDPTGLGLGLGRRDSQGFSPLQFIGGKQNKSITPLFFYWW